MLNWGIFLWNSKSANVRVLEILATCNSIFLLRVMEQLFMISMIPEYSEEI